MTQSTSDTDTEDVRELDWVDEDLVEVEYSRYGSERLRRLFSFFGISSPLDERSKPDDEE
ncbi:hypothetical protein [Halosegnis longus]|uniref:hypothetical protein n=1 Tax=Halosegnis longus TaxID=2216012 RepID=UPI00096A3887|nr:hypothetical protein [Salella cibi]